MDADVHLPRAEVPILTDDETKAILKNALESAPGKFFSRKELESVVDQCAELLIGANLVAMAITKELNIGLDDCGEVVWCKLPTDEEVA
jgi:hypothetical protein